MTGTFLYILVSIPQFTDTYVDSRTSALDIDPRLVVKHSTSVYELAVGCLTPPMVKDHACNT